MCAGSLVECQDINPEICKVIKDVIKRVRPDEKERDLVSSFAEKIRLEIERSLQDLDVPFSVEIHGSIAHNTWLSRDRDVDIFILLEKIVTKEYIKQEILERLKSRLNYKFEQRYAEHPYLRAHIGEFTADIVPGFRVGKIISAVDRTPLHTEFLKRNLSDELADEVRLLKTFLKGIGAYGAEIKTRGLSGYACELLVVHFGSFLKVLDSFSKEERIFIDFSKSWEKEKAIKTFRRKIIIIDPADRDRNVTANTSVKTFYLTKLASKMFLEKPSIKFFYPCVKENRIDLTSLKKRCFISVMLEKNTEIPPDTYWGQAKRIERLVRRFLGNIREIYLYVTNIIDSKKYIYIVIEVNRAELDPYKEIKGPPVWASTKDIFRFINDYISKNAIGPWLKGSKLVFLVNRPKSEKYLIDHLEKFIRRIRINPSFISFRILGTTEEIISMMKKYGVLNEFISFVNRRLPWLRCND